jgi:signal transduction histidine kinase
MKTVYMLINILPEALDSILANEFTLTCITIIGTVVITILSIIIWVKEIRFKNKINELIDTVKINQFIIEQIETDIRNKEREAIAQNLHDNLAGTLAAVKNNIDILILENEHTNSQNQLVKISSILSEIYNDLRLATHELFTAPVSDELLFSQQIKKISDFTFPTNKYIFNVDIDDDALINVSINVRSELIYIIKEAITNIIKHSNATKVSLLIYKDDQNLHIILNDNGKGFSQTTINNSLGLKSIKNRVEKINGAFSLKSISGVTLEIIVPF